MLQEINNALNELDPNATGTLSFKEFCKGVRAIRKRQKIQERKYGSIYRKMGKNIQTRYNQAIIIKINVSEGAITILDVLFGFLYES